MKETKMKLNVYERILLLGILPQESSFRDAIICKDLREKLVFTQNELKNYGIETSSSGNISWNKNKEAEFEFTEFEEMFIQTQMGSLDQKEKMPSNAVFLDLCKKFGYTGDVKGRK